MVFSATSQICILLMLLNLACGSKKNVPNHTINEPSPAVVATTSIDESTSRQNDFAEQICHNIESSAGKFSVETLTAEMSLVLKDIPSVPNLEIALVDSMGRLIPFNRLCTTDSKALLLSVGNQIESATLYVRENKSNKLFVVSPLALNIGTRIQFGVVQGLSGQQIEGKLSNSANVVVDGKINELNWSVIVDSNGVWRSGVLPTGTWSINFTDNAGKSARFREVPFKGNLLRFPPFALAEKQDSIAPLWSGILAKGKAEFLISSAFEATEMRISLDASFANVFWSPFRQIAEITIPTSGRHQVFAQMRDALGNESQILVHELTSQVLELRGQVDALVTPPVISLFDYYAGDPMTAIIYTVAPEGATEHSVTLDYDNLPRQWLPVSTNLQVDIPVSVDSCGRHDLFVRFRSSQGVESESLTRSVSVRCWDKNIPPSPLEARFGHAATAISKVFWNDSVLIWGGQTHNRLFNDGAILKKVNGQWVWQSLPPSPLSPRTRPFIVSGINHALIYGGEDLAGNAAEGWALYDYMNNRWIAAADIPAANSTQQPPSLKYPAVGFVFDANPEYENSRGAFLIVGGEKPDEPNESRISDKYYFLQEDDYSDWEPYWEEYTADLSKSRASFASGKGRNKNYFYVHGGITTPSGVPNSANPDRSGQEFELSGDMMVFGLYTRTNDPDTEYDDEVKIAERVFQSRDSRTGALHGNVYFVARPFNSESSSGSVIVDANFVDKEMESQAMCVYGGTKYTDEFPDSCAGPDDEQNPFCRRMNDAYLFAPIGRQSICFEPFGVVGTTSSYGHLYNFYATMDGAPKERKIARGASPFILKDTFNELLMYWSGMAPNGGEYLSDGAFYLTSADKWVPITQFEAPTPRFGYTATYVAKHDVVLIWGGQTAAGVTAGGAFYAMP